MAQRAPHTAPPAQTTNTVIKTGIYRLMVVVVVAMHPLAVVVIQILLWMTASLERM